MSLLTNGAFTIANRVDVNGATDSIRTIGGNTAHTSTFSGFINPNSGVDLRFVAANGGRANFTGTMSSGGTTRPLKIEAQPNGIVALAAAGGFGITRPVNVNSGTLLILNSSGSGAGSGAVTVASGAALGGTGIQTSAITASTATSILTPGDIDTGGDSQIGNLRLHGGLTANSGATFNFDINNASIDTIDFSAAALSLGGTATFNFTNLGTVLTGTPYDLFTGTGAWSGSPTFAFNAPAGYMLDLSYGDGDGYDWNPGANELSVQFAVIPEPASVVLTVGGAAIVVLRRRRD